MIPKIFHFIYLFGPDTREFDINHHISVRSNIIINKPDKVMIWSNDIDRLRGKGYEVAFLNSFTPCDIVYRNVSELVEPIREICGKDFTEIPYMAHQADIVRLYIMSKYGGVYSDVDSIAFTKLPDILYSLDKPVFWTERHDGEEPNSLCNGFFMSPKNSDFLNIWLKKYSSYDPDECKPGTINWTKYSVQLGWRLYSDNPGYVYVTDSPMDLEPFYLTYKDTCDLFFIDRMDELEKLRPYQVHLWETRNKNILKLFDTVYFMESHSTYAKLGKRYL